MESRIRFVITILSFGMLAFVPMPISNYDPEYVTVSTVQDVSSTYNVVYMRRSASGNRIKVKYFSSTDEDGASVVQRFREWSNGKDIICLSSGGYMDNNQYPVGINVDNGNVVNRTLENFDGLVIVFATGGVVASNLKDADLTLQGGDIPPGKKLNIRNSAIDRSMFLNWCESQYATVFQTHLLAYKNQLKISGVNSNQTKRERRFLVVGKDKESNEVIHAIVHSHDVATLYEGAKRTLNFLNKYKNMEVTFMINLDPGAQDVFFLFDEDGELDNTIHGTKNLDEAANLLVYYYE